MILFIANLKKTDAFYTPVGANWVIKYMVNNSTEFAGKTIGFEEAVTFDDDGKRVISFYIGYRTNKAINVVLKTLQFAKAKKIFTDRLKNYKYLIDKRIHDTVQYGTNHVERMHLSMRTHFKRLNRRTICFSRNLTVLNLILKIFFWRNFDNINLNNYKFIT